MAHACRAVQEEDWSGKENGELLALAETKSDVLVTLDTNFRYQQNLSGRRIAIVVLQAPSNCWSDLRPYFPTCVKPIDTIKPGDVVHAGSAT